MRNLGLLCRKSGIDEHIPRGAIVQAPTTVVAIEEHFWTPELMLNSPNAGASASLICAIDYQNYERLMSS